jgi:predicted alpha/beta superfamily hydrolase
MAKRSSIHWITLVALNCVFASATLAAGADQKVRVVVRFPPAKSAPESIFLAGSLPAVGNWKPDGLKLARHADGTFQAEVDLPIGQILEFKITRGSWATVEKNADGTDRANRRAVVDDKLRLIHANVERWASNDPAERLPATIIGNLKIHQLDSKTLGGPRPIRVWLPPGYDAHPNSRYSVLYVHDGQNCFDRATSAFGNEWQIDETLTKLISEKRVPPLIVVGIDNGLANRINELTYSADPTRGGGQADKYAEFLLTEVKPFVEKMYRTHSGPAHTFLGGSSLGGLMSLEMARRHPNTFGAVIAMSPTLWWDHESLTKDITKNATSLRNTRVWLDMGTREGVSTSNATSAKKEASDNVEAARRLDEALAKGHIERRLVIDSQHPEHNEPAWAARFPEAIEYLLNAK